ncbi:MAG: T9SS type A sorting domain-containing protein [Bacteroidota bacterium]
MAQHSVARQWNEALLFAIRNDLARPTVHARNLFHTSVAMYDAWALMDEVAEPFLLGKSVGDFNSSFVAYLPNVEIRAAREEAISYAAHRLLTHRFTDKKAGFVAIPHFDSVLTSLGYDPTYTSTAYEGGDPAALGNFIAEEIIAFGLTDNANEELDYANRFYAYINDPLVPTRGGNPFIEDVNRWQPLALNVFIDQSGNRFADGLVDFLSAEWGKVTPFALTGRDLNIYERDGDTYWVYHDPSPPPFLDILQDDDENDYYRWGFGLVSAWSSHLDPADSIMWDISPASIGNIPSYPTDYADYPSFYNFTSGGDASLGHAVNPYTGEPYAPQIVPRADYARVLAEFWADGPDSETPPGHWFTIMNYVHDHPLFERKFKGEGEELPELEWDVKAYLALGGAVHDAAISAWGVKGYYDYIRPISALRAMADRGQCSDPTRRSYSPLGVPLYPGFIELIEPGDPLAGFQDNDVGKIKVRAWAGPDFILDPETDMAGVSWIRAENWWPYQRPTFVTPPFAGYVSGHSTFSRAAAEVLTLLTGDPFFPGGMGEFVAPKNEFLVFEEGPSQDITLQWATYRDASDQTSLSRIWGGIHPPADDIPGRLIGIQVGIDAFNKAETYFKGRIANIDLGEKTSRVFPNPVSSSEILTLDFQASASIQKASLELVDMSGRRVYKEQITAIGGTQRVEIPLASLQTGFYVLKVVLGERVDLHKIMVE